MKCSEVLTHIVLPFNPRVNKVFIHSFIHSFIQYLVRLISYSPPRTVFRIESATISASPAPAIAACDPPLKAKKPKNRMNPPKAACCVKQQTINEHLGGFPLPEQLVGKIAFIVFQKLHTTPFIGGQKCHTPLYFIQFYSYPL